MTVHVFLGPSLPLDEARTLLAAEYHPPVAMGDVQNLVDRGRPTLIAIIDGFFEQRPAVWHKEILYAMKCGIPVYGASSMGALRAAELHSFGMIGEGLVFEAYRDGAIDADDEVAISHAPAEDGFRPLSDALVNIRFGLRLACAKQHISSRTQEWLLQRARATYYPERSWQGLFAAASGHITDDELAALRAFVKREKPDQKRADARALLQRVAREMAAGLQPATCAFDFEPTAFWSHAARTARRSMGGADESPHYASVHSHAQLTADSPSELRRGTLLMHLVELEARRLGIAPPTPSDIRKAAERFRRERGLKTAKDAREWLRRNELSDEEFTKLMASEHLLERVHDHYIGEVRALSMTELKRRGAFGDAAERLATQTAYLKARGLTNPTLADVGIDLATLFRWYEERFRPLDGTPSEHASRLCFSSLQLFIIELTALYAYEKQNVTQMT